MLHRHVTPADLDHPPRRKARLRVQVEPEGCVPDLVDQFELEHPGQPLGSPEGLPVGLLVGGIAKRLVDGFDNCRSRFRQELPDFCQYY